MFNSFCPGEKNRKIYSFPTKRCAATKLIGLFAPMYLEKEQGLFRMNLYELSGLPVAYCDDGVHIFLYSGQAVAYFAGECVYSFSGRHLGWRQRGWIIDHDGNCVLFSEQAEQGPEKFMTQDYRKKAPAGQIPEKEVRQFEPLRPPTSSKWSRTPVEKFFQDAG